MAAELSLDTRQEGAWTVVDVGGELDLSSAPALSSTLDSLIAGDASHVIVDLGDVSFMDSSGLGVVLEAFKAVTDSGGRMPLVVSDGPVSRLLEITGLTDQLDIHDSVSAAAAG